MKFLRDEVFIDALSEKPISLTWEGEDDSRKDRISSLLRFLLSSYRANPQKQQELNVEQLGQMLTCIKTLKNGPTENLPEHLMFEDADWKVLTMVVGWLSPIFQPMYAPAIKKALDGVEENLPTSNGQHGDNGILANAEAVAAAAGSD
jgi:hypothetical protein